MKQKGVTSKSLISLMQKAIIKGRRELIGKISISGSKMQHYQF